MAAGLLILLVGVVFLTYGTNDPLFPAMPTDGYLPVIHIGETPLRVHTADTPEKQQRGLSIFDRLAPATGMLFVFDHDDTYGIWMKDMKFAIDIIWVDAEGRIVDMEQHVAPETYPEVFSPHTPARYVIEVQSGFVEERSITPSDIVDLSAAL